MNIKNLLTIAILFFAISFVNAQTSTMGFNFQGYAIDPDGKALPSAGVTVRFTITPSGFTEEHNLTSDAFGVFHATIGNSSVAKNTEFSKIDFTKKGAIYTLKVEVKKTSGGSYTTISNEPMKAVPFARYAFNGVPVGTIVAYGGDKNNVPEGWLLCDGTSVSQTTYPQLYEIIGSAWGAAGASFNLPDLRGRFLRGVDDGEANDPDAGTRTFSNAGGNTGDLVGTLQTGATKQPNTPYTFSDSGNHSHKYTDPQAGDNSTTFQLTGGSTQGGTSRAHEYLTHNSHDTGDGGAHTHSITGGGDNETRPVNAAVYYIIKY